MELSIILILVGIVAIIFFISKALKESEKKKQLELEKFVEKVGGFLNGFAENGMNPIDSDINLNKEENLYTILKSVDWKEYRKVRTGNVAGHGIMGRVKIAKGINYRYGVGKVGAESVDKLKTIDSGDLYVTDKRIIFRGSQGNKSLPLNKILAVNPTTSGIEFEKEAGKNVYIPYDFMNNPDKLALIQFCYIKK